MINLLHDVILLLLIVIPSFIIFNIFNKRLIRKDVMERFPEILVILNKSKEVAYTKMFRDEILVQSSSGFRINKLEMDKYQKRYLKLVYLFCGSNIMDDLINIYGDLDSITAMLVNDFIQKIEDDEQNLMNVTPKKDNVKDVKING